MAPLAPIPVEALLVPASPPPAEPPPGMTLVDLPLAAGLPFAIPLADGWSLLLVLPTGQALRWHRAARTEVVAASADEEVATARPPVAEPGTRAPLRLLVRRGDGLLVAAVPLAAPGRLVAVPADRASPDAGLFLTPLAWDVRAGNLIAPGDWGGRIRLAWALARLPRLDWTPPPLHAYARRRLLAGRESVVGLGLDPAELEAARRAWTLRRRRVVPENSA